MPIAAPSNVIPAFKKVRDPFTNLQTDCEFTARLSFEEAQLHVKASIDGAAFADCTFDVLSNYPPMIRVNGITVPRDGLSHPVVLKFFHDDGAETSDEVDSSTLVAQFDMIPPADPTAVTATIIRDRDGNVPDQVSVTWDSAEDVYVICLDHEGKKRTVATMSETESSVILEGMTKYGARDGAVHAYRFGVQAFNRSIASNVVYSAPVNLTASDADVVEPTPDDIAGTAQYLTNAQFNAWLIAQFPAIDPANVSSILTSSLTKIKDVISKGGSVSLPDFGLFKAKWTPEKTTFRNGQYIVVPPVRNADFSFSQGFTKGTKLGQVMSDTEAALV